MTQTKFDIGQTVYKKDGEPFEITEIKINHLGGIYYNNQHPCECKDPKLYLPEASLLAEPPKTVYGLKEGDKCYCISSNGLIGSYTWLDCDFDKSLRELNSTFMTEEEAEAEKERRMIREIMRKHGGKDVITDIENFVIGWNCDTDVIEIDLAECENLFPLGGIYFKSAHDAIEAIIEIGRPRLRKAFLAGGLTDADEV